MTNLVVTVLEEWLEPYKDRKGEVSRSNVAIGIVVLDHLRNACPVNRDDVLSPGGEVSGSRKGSLKPLLTKYGIPEECNYLGEVTTRQGHPAGIRLFEMFGWGSLLGTIRPQKRDEQLLEGIERLVTMAKAWLARQALKVNCDGSLSPVAWIDSILEQAKGRRSGGKVEQHLVGAKLATRHPDIIVENHPGHAGDAQTGRSGDFQVGTTCYHVTAHPGKDVVHKCRSNIQAGLHPVLLVPRDKVERARVVADEEKCLNRLTIAAIEEFVAMNIIEMTQGDQTAFLAKLREIISTYNSRFEAVETDMSLKIDLQ